MRPLSDPGNVGICASGDTSVPAVKH